jgi:two-component system, NarL family, nitrate/nitrite response regulator NarL
MSIDSPVVPTFILQSDGLFREGLRLILSKTRFRPQGCGAELDELTGIPNDRPILFIVGIGGKHDLICKTIRSQYPFAFIVAVGDETNHKHLTGTLDEGANAVLFSSITPNALVSSLHAVVNGELIVIDARLWSLEVQAKAEERLASPELQDVASWDAQSEAQTVKLLSAREIAILERIVRGDSNKHVARFFKIAEPTVKAHVKAILRKIGASNRTQAAIWALNHRVFDGLNGTTASEMSNQLQSDMSGETLLQSPPSDHSMNGV